MSETVLELYPEDAGAFETGNDVRVTSTRGRRARIVTKFGQGVVLGPLCLIDVRTDQLSEPKAMMRSTPMRAYAGPQGGRDLGS